MKSGQFIQQKFQAWALRKNIQLQGSEGERGERNYTLKVEDNLFGGRLHPDARSAFTAGAGGELRGTIPSMSALHSSAAMAVNLFQYWLTVNDHGRTTLAKILDVPTVGIASMGFERKYPVCQDWKSHGFSEPPHLDFAIEYTDSKRVGIECKLFEPYGRLDHAKMKKAYLDLESCWETLPACRELARKLNVGDEGFHRLGPTQLLRHIAGLNFERPVGKIRLIYLSYDAIGEEASDHRAEIKRFQEIIHKDPIRFVPVTVQEVIARAVAVCRDDHREYVDYIADRYL